MGFRCRMYIYKMSLCSNSNIADNQVGGATVCNKSSPLQESTEHDLGIEIMHRCSPSALRLLVM